MISATLYGRIAREPELVQPMTGRDTYVRFSMAVETGHRDENGNRIAQFVSISVFGKQGDVIRQYFHKGNRIACHVRNLEAHAYTDKTNQPQASLNAVLTGVEFVETKAEQEQSVPQPAAGPQMGMAAGYSAPRQPASAVPPVQPAALQTLPGMNIAVPGTAPWEA